MEKRGSVCHLDISTSSGEQEYQVYGISES